MFNGLCVVLGGFLLRLAGSFSLTASCCNQQITTNSDAVEPG